MGKIKTNRKGTKTHLKELKKESVSKYYLKNKVSEESDKFFVVIECCEHNQSENMDF